MEAVHHLEVAPQILLSQVVQHTRVHQTLHEVRAVLRQTKTGQPFVPYPLMIHISIRQSLDREHTSFTNLSKRKEKTTLCSTII